MKIKKYYKIWLYTTLLSLQSKLARRGSAVIFILGKFIRFGFYVFSLLVIVSKTETIAGYDLRQLLNFFLVFNLFDLIGQFFFRGIYWLRGKIVSGMFDLTLLKPANLLFQTLLNDTDLLDLPLLLIVIIMLIKLNSGVKFGNLIYFSFLAFLAMAAIMAVHILVASVGIITTEIDNIIWIYRDLSSLARFPIDIYLGIIRGILTFVLPVAIVFTFPAKALMGILSWQWLVFSFVFTFLFLFFSLKFWSFSLKKYSSASS